MTIEEAVELCYESRLTGWELVEFAQRLVNSNMAYSYTNSFDLPKRAFKKSKGYCWHQSGALNFMLRRLGFESRLVYTTKNLIPEKTYEGVVVKEHYSGHVWCRVNIAGVEKDVCPGSTENKPGKVNFKPVSKVRPWNAWIGFWAYWGSAVLNAKRYREIVKRKKAQSL